MQDEKGEIDSRGPMSIIEYEHIRQWCEHFRCTEVDLAVAIALVGNDPDHVREYLAKGSGPPEARRTNRSETRRR